MKINELLVRGVDNTAKEKSLPRDSVFELSRSIAIGRRTRGEVGDHTVTLKEEDVLEMVFEDGTTWYSSTETLEDIFPEAAHAATRAGETHFIVPAGINYPATDRDVGGKVLLKVINILTKKTVKLSIEKLAADFENKKLEGKTGLFYLEEGFKLRQFSAAANDQPYCLLIHGTASSTEGSFGDARESGLLQYLRENYDKRILAFQHRTLTENPLQNVRELVQALPKRCTLHLITSSRGGLVGEVLSRFCNAEEGKDGFTEAELAYFNEEYPEDYYNSIELTINEIKDVIQDKDIIIEKYIRVACPARGTTLASKRLDRIFNILFNLIGFGTGSYANPVYVAFKNLMAAVVDTKNKVDVLPGLEAQSPSSPFIKVINGITMPVTEEQEFRINNSLVVIAGNSKSAFNLKALWVIASKLFFMHKNDMVVDTDYMALGTGRTGRVLEFLHEQADFNHFKYFENKITVKAIQQALKSKWGSRLAGFSEKSITMDDYREGVDLSQIEIEDPLGDVKGKADDSEKKHPIKVSICKGDLQFATYPIIAGHFEGDGILYAEKAIDYYLNEMLTHRYQLGIYPGALGSSEVFLQENKEFKGAVIVGLGEVGKLTETELTRTVEKGVTNYLLQCYRCHLSGESTIGKVTPPGISALIIGSGYGGLTIENSIKAIIQGVYNANENAQNLGLEKITLVEHLEFVELYEDKAVSALFSISRIEKEATRSFAIEMEKRGIKALLGYRTRILADETGGWWNRISIVKKKDKQKNVRQLIFKATTGSSREEEQPLFTTPALIEKLLEDISTNHQWSVQKAKTVFELLIPNDFKDRLKKHGNIIWVLDEYTASYPWELLQDRVRDTKPICVSSGMIRQLTTMNYSKNIRNVTENNALIIADPDLEGYYGQLPGAKAEGLKVFDIFSDKFKRLGGEVELSVNDKHTDILEKLFMKDYKIIHLSGHGVFRPDDPGRSGMVIGKDQYLSTREVKQLSSAAELVFINCCHLGKADGVSEELYQKRYQLAANMGIQLINNGVRCVIAAGWAINDRAAEIFADVFYDCMFAGENFADAIKKARIAVYEYNSEINTWGAYQCYGDPFYKFRLSESKGSGYTYMIEQQAEVDLTNLRHELEMGRDKDEEKYLAKLEAITQAVKDAKIINPRILELEALIYMDLGEYDISNEKFEKLMDEERASFSFSSAEKFCNVKAKKAVADYKDSKSKKSESLKKIDEAINHLDHLIQLSETSERLNLIGSAYKRKALLSAREGKKRAYNMAALKYREAYHEANKESENWYSKTNWLALESVLVAIGWHKWGSDVDQKRKKVGYKLPPTGEVERMLDPRKVQSYREVSRLHYWDLIYEINVRLARYILRINKRNAEKGKNDILKRLENLWKVAGSRGKKISEVENLEFLIDAASLGDNPKSKLLVNYLGKLKTGIEDML